MSLTLFLRFISFLLSGLFIFCSSQLYASGFGGELALEGRYFFKDSLTQNDQFSSSMRAELSYQKSIESNYFDFVIFGRVDQMDSERSHVDIREANWTYVDDAWELKLGLSKVFWGVTESRHLVDIINQTDLVENLDSEDKLGQPMVKFALEKDWGSLDVFWLPYFREQIFMGKEGRLNPLPYPIDSSNAFYESSAEQWHSDFAIRYALMIDDLDIAISHFTGTSRTPMLRFNNDLNNPLFTPVYNQIDQTGVELQYIYDDWIWKFEGVASSGEYQRYSAAVFGFEYTQVGLLDSAADLGWIVEYLFDDRRNQANTSLKAAPHSFERDVFLGWRYAMNNIDSTELLAGVIYDPKTEEAFYSVEYSQRTISNLKLNIELRIFDGGEDDNSFKTYYMRDEDYIQLELVKFF